MCVLFLSLSSQQAFLPLWTFSRCVLTDVDIGALDQTLVWSEMAWLTCLVYCQGNLDSEFDFESLNVV